MEWSVSCHPGNEGYNSSRSPECWQPDAANFLQMDYCHNNIDWVPRNHQPSVRSGWKSKCKKLLLTQCNSILWIVSFHHPEPNVSSTDVV